MSKTLTIIPARRGSKRIPRKNLRKLNGLSLIEHSIIYAQNNIEYTQHICISTDDSEILKVAKKYNVDVVKRPKELSGDLATTVSAIKHVLQTLDNNYENVVLLQPTNPLRPKNLLKEAYGIYSKSKSDSLITVSKNDKKLGKITDGKYIPYSYKMGQRSQDIDPLYFENGLLYITKASLILEDKILSDSNIAFIVDHPYSLVDIDEEDDFKFAEFVLNNYPNE
ncbi:acylneuraminate cytidylyltransferase family protein [Winogradskyella luteola]|uniref:Acylneuraminate cytidylyltransferase family protein n=1 Tax=Winogradskyella luteola TaxID=2828330 RepID=A0A9X1F717_9FLAO|nr:acylneuraminate cytidylyltransferase family protein [Winogradskyella luteola]MBV7268546.1 acylneuraminate cytidylyltransferase family protein [Winogradskyella luteola]